MRYKPVNSHFTTKMKLNVGEYTSPIDHLAMCYHNP